MSPLTRSQKNDKITLACGKHMDQLLNEVLMVLRAIILRADEMEGQEDILTAAEELLPKVEKALEGE